MGRSVALFGWHGTDPAAVFLYGLREKHDLPEAEFLVDQFGSRTALARLGLNGRVNYTYRTLLERWFHTLKIRIDRFYTSWVGSQASVRKWVDQLAYHYISQTLCQTLDIKTPAEEVQN